MADEAETRREGEAKLRQAHRQALNISMGKSSAEEADVSRFSQQYGIPRSGRPRSSKRSGSSGRRTAYGDDGISPGFHPLLSYPRRSAHEIRVRSPRAIPECSS